MTYVLGDAAATGAPLRLQFTVAGDDLATLGRAYGVTPKQIWDMQPQGGGAGKRMERKPVQSFVKALPGWTREAGMHPFSAALNPGTTGPDGKPEGFAHFTANTQLMLPDMARLDGKNPRSAAPDRVVIEEQLPSKEIPRKSSKSVLGVLLLGSAAVLGLVVLNDKKKRKAQRTA